MFWQIIIFLPVILIFSLILILLLIYFNKKEPMELENDGEIEENDEEIEATGNKLYGSKKAKRRKQKQEYKEYMRHLREQRNRELQDQDAQLELKRQKELATSPKDKEWQLNQEMSRKLLEIKMELKGDVNDVVEYIQKRDLIYLEELEILYFYSKSEILKLVDYWIQNGIIHASRHDNMIYNNKLNL
eukprot:NODE_1279_length_1458_cov_0.532009.p1 type:complete len:188 gc:universal NODE_1279_length_1458_cov_0.532009:994-431(-)